MAGLGYGWFSISCLFGNEQLVLFWGVFTGHSAGLSFSGPVPEDYSHDSHNKIENLEGESCDVSFLGMRF